MKEHVKKLKQQQAVIILVLTVTLTQTMMMTAVVNMANEAITYKNNKR